MSDINATARVDLVANGQQAAEQLTRLKKRAEDLKDAIAKAAREGNKADCKKWERELRSVRREMRNIQSATQNVEDVMRRLDKATPKELKNTLRQLEKELQNIERGSKAWNEHTEKIRKVKATLKQVNSELAAQESRWQKMNRVLNNWQTSIMGAVAAVTGLVMAGKKAVSIYAEMEQEMANVRKFTGMTAEQVESLNEELKKIDTRSSRQELNKLAQEAGRLGLTSQEDVLGFVRAADKINVALDDLGDGATLTLSKLTGIFGDRERLGTEKSLLAVGSVINELSQNCAASAPYLAEFASRMGGVGAQAKMTVQQIMGIGAVLDSNNQKVEASATAISQVITRMYQDPAKYAKAAGLDVQQFAELVRSDANEALLTLAESLNAKGGLKETAPLFKEMGENGARAISALATLAEHISEVRAQQVVANKAFEEATSVTQEFDVQNNTVQASLDKAKNKFNELAADLGQKLLPVMRYAISSTSAIMRAMLILVNFIIKYKGELIALASAIATYTLVVNANAIATKAWAFATKAASVITGAFKAVVVLASAAFYELTGKTRQATVCMKAFNATVKANPLGLAISAIIMATTALMSYIKRTKEAELQQKALRKEQENWRKELRNIDSQSAEYAKSEITRLKALYEEATNEAKSKEERIAAAKKLQQLYPDYFKNLSIEKIMVGEAKDEYDKLTESILNAARARAAAEKIQENEKTILELEDKKRKKTEEQKSAQQKVDNAQAVVTAENNRKASSTSTVAGAFAAAGQSEGSGAFTTSGDSYQTNAKQLKEAKENLQEINDDLAEINTQMDDLNAANKELAAKYIGSATALSDAIGDGDASVSAAASSPGSSSSQTVDKFASEKAWKEKEEYLNKIAYLTGKYIDEKGEEAVYTYSMYTDRMLQIEVEYGEKRLEHTDLTESESLQIQAEYLEAKKKQEEAAAKKTIDAENKRHTVFMAVIQQRYIDGEMSQKDYDEWLEREEETHLQQLLEITEKGTAERQEAERKYRERKFKLAQAEQKKEEDEEKAHQDRLSKIKDSAFGNTQAENDALYKSDLADLDEVYAAELAKVGDNAEEKLRLEEAYNVAKLAIMRKYNQEGADEQEEIMKRMFMGAAKWLESDGGQAFTKSFDMLVSGMSNIFSQLTTMMQAELEIQTAEISNRYDKEISAAEGNAYKVAQLEKQKEKEIAEAKQNANRKMFAMQVIQAVAQTAQGAISAYSSAAAIPVVGWLMAPIAAGLALAAGAMQIAAIKKQQQASEATGYAEGGFTPEGGKYEPAGIVHRGEWVASQKLTHSPVTRPFIEALDYAQRTNTIGTFRTSDAVATATRTVAVAQQPAAPSESTQVTAQLAGVIGRLNKRLDEPFVTVNSEAGELGMKQAREKYEKLIRNKSPKS